ncbi:hypothetical protein [Blastococcus sp. SYSU DS0539]
MLPAVRPFTLLVAGGVGVAVLNGLSIWLRLLTAGAPAPLEELGAPFAGYPLLYRLFNTDGETNVPTWFTVLLLVGVAAVCAGIAAQFRRCGVGAGWRWTFLAVIFLYLSVDELAALHEETMPFMAQVVEAEGAFTFPWILIAAPLVVVLALFYAPFVWHLPRGIGVLLLLAGFLYVGGAIGMEAVGGHFYEGGQGYLSTGYVWATTVEELLEMAGAAVALYAVALFAQEKLPQPPVTA